MHVDRANDDDVGDSAVVRCRHCYLGQTSWSTRPFGVGTWCFGVVSMAFGHATAT